MRADTVAGLDLAAGDELVWVSGRQRFTEEVLAVKDGVATIRSSREGTVDQPLEFALPPVRWEGGPDGKGANRILSVHGRLFPLAPDNSMSLTYQGSSDADPDGWKDTRVCLVGQPAEAQVPAGRFAVLPVTCQEASRSRTWLFAPSLGLVVRYDNAHRVNGNAVQELVEVRRAPRP